MPKPARPIRLRGPALADFESRSRANLKRKGGRLYWEDPSSEALCAVIHDVPSGETYVWRPGDPPPVIETAAAHNASTFDRHAARACGWRVDTWLDTASAARRAGLPGALDALAQRWLGRSKDKAGSKFTVALSRPSRAKARLGQLPDITPEVRARVEAYCADDVQVLAEAWDRLEPWFDVDREACEVDAVINDRGICLDVDLVRALQRQIERQQERAIDKAARQLHQSPEVTRAQASSPKQFTEITGLPNAQKDTLEEAIVNSPARYGREAHPLVFARKALASVVPGKLAAALERVSPDGHTGRWAGYGLQPHNLNRISFEGDAERLTKLTGREWHVDDYIEALIDGAFSGADLTKKQVSGLLRSVLVAEDGDALAVQDYSGIEARVNAWAAGDEGALEVFRAMDQGGADPYCLMASDIFGREITKADKIERNVGKQAELGCGYQMGADKFGATCLKAGVDLAKVGVDPEDVVSAWRTRHAPIARLWRDCQDGFRKAAQGHGGERGVRAGTAPWRYVSKPAADGRGGVDVWCVLPSGRPIVYPNARAKRVTRTSKSGSKFQAWDLSYQGRYAREHIYGGMLVENAVQAVSRDLLADALPRFEAAGLQPVGHVHDEAICSVYRRAAKEGLAEMRHIMSDAPRWARGLPIRLDGFTSRRYRK